MKLIDKDAVMAEIERQRKIYMYDVDHKHSFGRMMECNDLLVFLDTLEVKEVDLEESAITAADKDMQGRQIMEESNENRQLYSRIFRRGFKDGAKWQQEKEYTCYEEAFEDGAKWKVENILKPADSDNLPEYDREVIVLTQPYPLESHEFAVSFAHRPNPDGWDGKSVTTDKVEHYTPKTYGKGGWNIPDVKYWLDVKLPKEIEL